jgi:hypothetical protein
VSRGGPPGAIRALATQPRSTGIVGRIAAQDARPTEEVSMRKIQCAIVMGAALLAATSSAQAQRHPASRNVSRSSMCQVVITGRDGRRHQALARCAAARGYAPSSSRQLRGNGLRMGTEIGTYDPSGGIYDPRHPDQGYPDSRNGGVWDRRGDRRQSEWERNRGRHGDDDEDNENDDDDDGDDDDRGGNARYDGRYDPRGSGQGCTDLNGDGICDYRQIPLMMTRARLR